MLYGKEEPLITFMDGNALKEGLNSFYVFKIEYRNIVLPRGTQHMVKIVLPSAQTLHKISLHLCQDSQLNLSHLVLSWWVRQCCTWREAVPHPGTTALSVALPHLSDRWEAGGIYTFPCPPQRLSLLLQRFRPTKNRPELSFFLHWHTLSSQATPLIPPSILERKGAKTRLEISSTDFQSQKSIWFTFLPTVVFVTLGALLLAS
jgi:hypothetical protein